MPTRYKSMQTHHYVACIHSMNIPSGRTFFHGCDLGFMQMTQQRSILQMQKQMGKKCTAAMRMFEWCAILATFTVCCQHACLCPAPLTLFVPSTGGTLILLFISMNPSAVCRTYYHAQRASEHWMDATWVRMFLFIYWTHRVLGGWTSTAWLTTLATVMRSTTCMSSSWCHRYARTMCCATSAHVYSGLWHSASAWLRAGSCALSPLHWGGWHSCALHIFLHFMQFWHWYSPF